MYHYYKNPESTVLTQNTDYHMDHFSVVMQWWKECRSRLFLDKYQKETELNFLIYYYLNGLNMMAICYTDLKYQEFQKICQNVRETVPNYKNNPYIKEILSEIDQLQISLIDQNVSLEEFAQLIQLLRDK